MATGQLTHAQKNIRILALTSTFPRWQSDTIPGFIFDLTRRYVQSGIKVDVIAPHAHGAMLYEEMDGVAIYRFKYFFERYQKLAYNGGILANLKKNKLTYLLIPLFLLFQSLAIIKRIKNEKYDLIHAHWLIPQAFICVFILKFILKIHIPVLCTSHGGDLYAFNGTVMQIIKKWIAMNCAHLCVVSETMKRDCLALGIANDNISILPMGVDLGKLFTTDKNIQRNPNKIIFVGRLVEKKGVEILLDSFVMVLNTIPSAELVLIGDGPLRKNLEDKVNSNGLDHNVKFAGSVRNSKLPALYSSANIAVMPSIIDTSGDREGLGLVMIEAMGCDCAVVASAMGPMTEIIEHEKTGLLFEPGNAQDLSKQLIRLLTDTKLTRLLAKNGSERVRRQFDWVEITNNYMNLINRICAN